MKTAELTGALLDYWVARAEGVPADALFFYQTPYSKETVCGRHPGDSNFPVAICYSTSWAQCGPLIEKYNFGLYKDSAGWVLMDNYPSYGDTPLQAICRAVVRAAFGDEVEEVEV